jgi:hypothetical protein
MVFRYRYRRIDLLRYGIGMTKNMGLNVALTHTPTKQGYLMRSEDADARNAKKDFAAYAKDKNTIWACYAFACGWQGKRINLKRSSCPLCGSKVFKRKEIITS